MSTAAAPEGGAELRPFFFDVREVEGHTLDEMFAGSPDADELYDLLGRDLVTKALVRAPGLSLYHESAKPGERVKPHRHGTLQIDYVLRGELVFGNRRLTAGMGAFIPNTLYSWRAGDEGAEWLEIHAGEQAGIYTDRP